MQDPCHRRFSEPGQVSGCSWSLPALCVLSESQPFASKAGVTVLTTAPTEKTPAHVSLDKSLVLHISPGSPAAEGCLPALLALLSR